MSDSDLDWDVTGTKFATMNQVERLRAERDELRDALVRLADEACGNCQQEADDLNDGMCYGCFAWFAISKEPARSLLREDEGE